MTSLSHGDWRPPTDADSHRPRTLLRAVVLHLQATRTSSSKPSGTCARSAASSGRLVSAAIPNAPRCAGRWPAGWRTSTARSRVATSARSRSTIAACSRARWRPDAAWRAACTGLQIDECSSVRRVAVVRPNSEVGPTMATVHLHRDDVPDTLALLNALLG